MDKNKDEQKIKKIVNELTGDICIHGYPITRDEAENLGLNIYKADKDLDKLMWKLYSCYAEEMKLGVPFHPLEFLQPGKDSENINYSGAYIESIGLSDQFIYSGKVSRIIKDNKQAIDIKISSRKWERVK